jgi:hypothetical protein
MGMGLMTNVQRRGSVYYYRRRVPLDLQSVIGRAVIKESLNERDPTRARQVHAQRAAWWEERFALLRRRMSAETAPLRRDLSPEEIQSLADGYRHMFLNADEQIRLRGLGGQQEGLPDDQFERHGRGRLEGGHGCRNEGVASQPALAGRAVQTDQSIPSARAR